LKPKTNYNQHRLTRPHTIRAIRAPFDCLINDQRATHNCKPHHRGPRSAGDMKTYEYALQLLRLLPTDAKL
jgi:hypothetical protein